ncbi:hypothetical protein K1719_028811 [Acacia pycnantha]|nr:hypothetical protein K1719_028811 [Acacia pycnantha]
MASLPTVSVLSSEPPKLHNSNIRSIKAFADANGLSLIPSSYFFVVEARDNVADYLSSSIPIIDFSLLISDHPQFHADAISLLNHGISEKLMEEVMNKAHEFHNLLVRKRRNSATRVPRHPSTRHKLLISSREGSLLEGLPLGPHIPTIQFPIKTSWFQGGGL